MRNQVTHEARDAQKTQEALHVLLVHDVETTLQK